LEVTLVVFCEDCETARVVTGLCRVLRAAGKLVKAWPWEGHGFKPRRKLKMEPAATNEHFAGHVIGKWRAEKKYGAGGFLPRPESA